MAERTAHDLLLERTTARNAQIWVDWEGGRRIPDLLSYEAVVNDAHYYDIYQYIDIAREDYNFMASLREDGHEFDQLSVDTEREIARLDYQTRIQILALDKAGKNLLLKAKEYDTLVKAQIMTAKEYLAAVQNAELWLEKVRAEMAVDKEEARLKELAGSDYPRTE